MRKVKKGHMSLREKTNIKKYTKKHLKKYPFCTKIKITYKKGT